MPPSLLCLCARIQTHDHQQQLLTELCTNFKDWDGLLDTVEKHGMGPLLEMHLAPLPGHVPYTFLRELRFLSLRHQQANKVLMKSLGQVLSLLQEAGIPSLVLKGAALCRTLYPAIGLRPMRDIDLLLATEDVQHAHALLQRKGFRSSADTLPEGYFHLPPLVQKIEGIQVCLELHHGLFPDDPPYYRKPPLFSQLYRNAQAFNVDGMRACTLELEEMLWHLYQHGFHAPLTYEPYRLISAADIISLVEANVEKLDWHKIETIYPQLFRALPLFHFLTPWQDSVLKKIPFVKRRNPSGVGDSYRGWPSADVDRRKNKGFFKVLRQTLFPSQWWLMLYYSTGMKTFPILWCRGIQHPLHILRWIKVHGTTFRVKQKT